MMTIKETVEKHRELWYEVADLLNQCEDNDTESFVELMGYEGVDIDAVKAKAMENLDYDREQLIFDCFACTFAAQNSPVRHRHSNLLRISPSLRCPYCPLDWGTNTNGEYVPCYDRLFGEIESAMKHYSFSEASELADLIAEVPLKPEFEEE